MSKPLSIRLPRWAKPNAEVLLVLVATFSSLQLWTFQSVPPRVYDLVGILALLLLAAKSFFGKTGSLTLRPEIPLHNYAMAFLWIPVLSYISAYFVHDQSPLLSLLIQRTNFLWLVYFILHKYSFRPEKLMQLMLLVGFVWAFLTIFQQFTFPRVWFYSRLDLEADDPFEVRAGIYRFMVRGAEYGVFGLFFLMNRFLSTNKNKYLVGAAFLVSGIFYFATRQILFASVACLVILLIKYLSVKLERTSVKVVLMMAVAILAVVVGFDSLFGGFVAMTRDDATSDNIRILSTKFFLFDYWDHWICYIFGNGLPHSWSPYGAAAMKNQLAGFWQNDVGVVGAFNLYGIFYVMATVGLYVSTLLRRVPFSHYYFSCFFIYCVINSLVASRFNVEASIPFFCFVFYMYDKAVLSGFRSGDQSVAA